MTARRAKSSWPLIIAALVGCTLVGWVSMSVYISSEPAGETQSTMEMHAVMQPQPAVLQTSAAPVRAVVQTYSMKVLRGGLTPVNVSFTDEKSPYSNDQPPSRKPFAYMFYITNDVYACAALIFMDRLAHRFHMDTTQIEFAVVYTDAVSSKIIDNMHRFVNARTILVEAVNAEAPDRHWLHSLTKLRAFQEWGYDRIVYFDADATPQTNLDHLFYLPPAPLYAPNAYWLPQPFFASTLLVIEPNNATYDDMIKWARARGAGAGYDMDILNSYFVDTALHLPGEYTVLLQDFRRPADEPSAPNSLYATAAELKDHVKIVHFSCSVYGKPWLWAKKDLSILNGTRIDPFYGNIFTDYWDGERELCSV